MSSSQTRLQGEILKFIHDRHFEQGERLFSEREFAGKFDTTRAAVREAITALEALRVVERRKHSGIYLRDMDGDTSIDALVVEVNAGILPSLANIENAIELRHVLEVGAIRHAAIRRNNSDIEALQQVLDVSDNKLAEGQSIIDEDVMFHKTIVASTQNSLLVRVVNWFYEFSSERRARYFADFEISQISHSEHQLIFDGLRNGDPDKCAALLGDHLQHTTRLWSAILTESEELSS